MSTNNQPANNELQAIIMDAVSSANKPLYDRLDNLNRRVEEVERSLEHFSNGASLDSRVADVERSLARLTRIAGVADPTDEDRKDGGAQL